MPKKRWTSTEQRSWLEERIPPFIQAQQNKATSTFLDDIYRDWQERWPIEPPTEKELQSAKGIEERALAVKRKTIEDVSLSL
jgi:hypothetical protein